MKLSSMLVAYATSGLSLMALVIASAGGVFFALSGLLPPPVAAAAAAALYVATSAYLIASPWGAKALAEILGRRRSERDRATLTAVKGHRDALSCMRIADPELGKAIMGVILAADRYLEAADASDSRDPVAEHAILESREIVDIFLKGMDAEATERHFGLASDLDEASHKAQTLALLKAKAEGIASSAAGLRGEAPPEDTLDIKKELP